jgi:uncharacterized protein
MPSGPWIMAQTWHDLLFAHWPIAAAQLRSLIPVELDIDTLGGQAWLGIVPFRMTGVRARGTPALPWLSAFPELNVRTYVRYGGKPGVWFFSLDAANPIAVAAARILFHLPYFHARMSCRPEGGGVTYQSVRRHPGVRSGILRARYRPVGPVFHASPGSLEYFLTERYCLFAKTPLGRLRRCEIHHSPWPLQFAEADFAENTMAESDGIALPVGAPLLHFAKRQDVVVWRPLRATS